MELRVRIFWAATGRWMCKTCWHRHESQLFRASNVPYDQKVPKKPWYLKILKSINFVSKKEYKVILRVWGQGMWLHESESNSIITEAYENKIFLTIIYISNNSHLYIMFHHQCIGSIRLLAYNFNIQFRDHLEVLQIHRFHNWFSQWQRRPLQGPSPCWKRQLALSH